MKDIERTRILVVDDMESGRYAIARTIRAAGFFVIEASSGAEALKKAVTDEVDLAVLDINLPDMSGYDVCRRIKGNPETASIPVLHLTATYRSTHDKVAGLDGGADGFLFQPVESEELLSTIKSLLRIKRAERETEKVARQWHATFDSIGDAISILDREGRILKCNRAFRNLAGRPEGEIIGYSCREIVHHSKEFMIGCPLLTARERGDRCQIETEIGGRWFQITVDPVLDGKGDAPSFVHVLTDISARKKAEAEQALLITAIEQAGEAIVITDTGGVVQYINPAFERTTGYERTEVIGNHSRILKSGHHDSAFYMNLWQTISSGLTWEGRIVNKRKDGTLFTEDVTISPVRDASGRVINYVAVKHDITENIRLMSQIQQSQKMDSVGRLAGGVAHDFNNMLGVILGHSEMAMDMLDHAHPVYEDLEEIRKTVVRSSDLTRQLLAFARKQTIAPRVLDLNETVEGLLKMLRRLIGENIDLAWLPGKNICTVRMDPAQIDQILINLCVNARDAIHGVGKITIQTRTDSLESSSFADNIEDISGRFVMLAVTDTGSGMDKEILDKLFEPFFTTKELGKGTGLGLATVYGIVKQNSGYIDVDSQLGKGSTFKVYLPCHQSADEAAEAPEPEKPMPSGTETVLLVEDETALLTMTEKVLMRLGYTVLAASTPGAAVRMADAHSGPIHLLVTDVVMPEMNGLELMKRLQSGCPGLKCLFMSGYTADVIANQGVLDHDVHIIHKPFSRNEIAAKVRQVLDLGK